MRIIVDANVVFSGILNTHGKIGDLLINSRDYFDFIAPDFLRFEIKDKYDRLLNISKLTSAEILEAEYQVSKEMNFISEVQIDSKYWYEAEKLVIDIDPKDVHYIAYSKHFKSKLWSGDKQLRRGLEKKGFRDIITTDELFKIRTELQGKKIKTKSNF